MDLTYSCSTTRLTNILHRDNDIKHSFDTSLVGYLDDTTWKGESLYINALNRHHQTLNKRYLTQILRPIVLQKLDILTREIWYPTIPHKYIDSITKPSYLAKSLALISLYDFKIDLTIDWKTIGGTHTLEITSRIWIPQR
ncbi:hypothetical protein RIR_jg28043.t1 [Rhizophagus irregularis DAOM 181602=DAOM 197198]|nr:hypothetical protein RIR_jg28043.t1 [Rhizophagus irregularis DAOM 181602=DAOM 197198]